MFNKTIGTIVVVLSLLALTTTYASDLTKVNLNADNPVKRYFFKDNTYDRVIVLSGDVDYWNIEALILQLESFSKDSNKPVFLDIDSPGGSVRAGTKLINTIIGLKQQKGLRVYCVITGSAYSMAAVISSYCHETYMSLGADMMFHGASYTVRGTSEEVLTRVLHITKWLKEMEINLATQMNITYQQFIRLRERELWLTEDSAIKLGFVKGTLTDFFHTAKPPVKPLFPFSLNFYGEDRDFLNIDFKYKTYIDIQDIGLKNDF